MAASNNVPSNCTGGSFLGALNCGSGVAADSEGQTALTLLTTLVASGASFGAQFAIFLLIRQRLSSIYRPRSYLVPENERVPPPPPGIWTWLPPLFNTPNLAFIQKCGLDAYFFLRYLRLLLKIFVPCAIIILPILLPINNYSAGTYVGLNKLAIGNVAPQYTGSRLWAHLVLAIAVILWVCYVVYRELRGYIRVRQAYLTSPQHRIRASATTVLVTGIPRKWLTVEALNGLYDVFPGGIRNIWINRNYDELADKVSYRNSLAESLEDAETNLIKMCRKSNERAQEEQRKEDGRRKKTKEEVRMEREEEDAAAQTLAQGRGVSAGDQHDHPQSMQDVLEEAEDAEQQREEQDASQRKRMKRFGMLGDGLGAIGQGFEDMGKGVGKIGRGVDNGIRKAADNVDQRNLGKGFVDDDELYRPRKRSDFALDEPPPPSPPPKTPFEERQARLQQTQIDGSNNYTHAAFQDGDASPTSTTLNAPASGRDPEGTPTSLRALNPSNIRVTGPSTDSKRMSPFQIEDPLNYRPDSGTKWKFWKNNDHSLALPSPRPHTAEDDDEFPLALAQTRSNASRGGGEKGSQQSNNRNWTDKLMFWKHNEDEDKEAEEAYPVAFQKDLDEDQDGNAYWRRYLEPKERETMRVPIFSPTWCPSLPLLGKKVDRIYYLRRELARMNLEVEMDQASPEKFPYMNSAFIQFNHQVAAHMACQSVSHHIPQHMAPRLVEISPDDVLWSNMSTVWWERYLRSAVVLIIAIGLIILYAIPVTFASLLSNFSTLARLKPFSWIEKLPTVIITALQGVVGPAFLGLILTLIPIIFRVLVQQQGVPTGTTRELGVQQWYFAFLFIQVFLVVSIAGGITVLITSLASNPASIVGALGKELPKASNYFFYYLLVQALSASASGILQIGSLVGWFILGPLLDSTARAKWRRQTTLQNVTWGTFYPPFTNFAVIGLVYSVIAPLILVFMLIIVGLFWVVYRYNVLYVFQFRNDTGGLLFPTAVNQLFVGVYTMELCLIGFFFVARDQNDEPSCIPQAIIMIVAAIFTILYQWLMSSAFRPLLRYLPITLEDEAVMRDEEFARAQASKFAPLAQQETDGDDRDIQDVLQDQERRESEYEDRAADRQKGAIAEHRQSTRASSLARSQLDTGSQVKSPRTPRNRDHLSVGQHTWHTDRWRQSSATSSIPASDAARLRHITHPHLRPNRQARAEPKATEKSAPSTAADKDLEAQNAVGDALFSGFADELEDLTPDERDLLVRYAFQHAALRAKRPVVWIPRDQLGVSDDEIARAEKMSTVVVPDNESDDGEEKEHVNEKRERGKGKEKTNIWMSNEGTALDGEGNVVFRCSPPDFSNVDLIAL